MISGLTNGSQYYLKVNSSSEFTNIPSECRTDFDGDSGIIDYDDFFLFADHFGEECCSSPYEQKYDLNGNKEVDDPDTDIFDGDFGLNCNVVPKALATPLFASGINRYAVPSWTTDREGSQIVLTYSVDNLEELSGFGLAIDYDDRMLRLAEYSGLGELFSKRGEKASLSVTRSTPGRFIAAAALKRGYDAVAGSGMLLDIRFDVLGQDEDIASISLAELALADRDRAVDRIISQGVVQEAIDEVAITATPNPSNPSTTIAFSLPVASMIGLDIFDLLGQRIRELIPTEQRGAGTYSVVWDGHNTSGQTVASGIYFTP